MSRAVSWGSHHSQWGQQPGAESLGAGRCSVAIWGAAGSLQACRWWLYWFMCLFLLCLPASWRLGVWMSSRRGSLPWTPWWSRRLRRFARSTNPSVSPSSTPSKPRSGGSRTSEPRGENLLPPSNNQPLAFMTTEQIDFYWNMLAK